MKIRICYQDQMYNARVFNHYSVLVMMDKEPVVLNQCRECGVWCSEDDELYGNGYCTDCAVICDDCQMYFSFNSITTEANITLCTKCLKKNNKNNFQPKNQTGVIQK